MFELANCPLGKKNTYFDQYDPSLLFAINRAGNRINIGIDINHLPFCGKDIWNGFDFTYLDAQSKPQYAVLTLNIPCESKYLIESKSLKLYLFSFANTKFSSKDEVVTTIQNDLSKASESNVTVTLENKLQAFGRIIPTFFEYNLDSLEVVCVDQNININLLQCDFNNIVEEQLCSDLLKSNCLVTGKPDWGSVRISYKGPRINKEGLLKYIISYRNHQGFHEQCIEKIYFDILTKCKPQKLAVAGRYTRRGGLDINPIRANSEYNHDNTRLFRQ